MVFFLTNCQNIPKSNRKSVYKILFPDVFWEQIIGVEHLFILSQKIHEGCTRPCFCPMRELLYIIVIICRMCEIFSSMRSLWAWHLVEMRVTRLMRETWQVCSICNAVLGKRDTGFPKWMRESKHNSMHVTDGKRDVSFPKRDARI